MEERTVPQWEMVERAANWHICSSNACCCCGSLSTQDVARCIDVD